MSRAHLAGLIVATLLACPGVAPCQVQFKGELSFEWIEQTYLKKPAAGTKIPMPKDSKVELVRVRRLLDESLAIAKVTDAKGSYAFPAVMPKAGDEFQINVYLSTLRSDPAKKEKEAFRVHGRGYNAAGVNPFDFYLETKNFDDKRANKGVSTINCHFGNDTDKDGTNGNGYERNELSVNTKISLATKVNEVYGARFAAAVLVLDQNYRDIEASNKIPWWNKLPSEGVGLEVSSPTALAWKGTPGVTVPHGAIHALGIQIRGDSLNAATASHEFGHFLHYHTTHWVLVDFVDEVVKVGHWPSQESGRKVALAEGFAEFYGAVWMRQFANKLVVSEWAPLPPLPWDPWIDPESQGLLKAQVRLSLTHMWKGGPRKDPYLLDGTTVDGTDNSGEVVEGAVAQAFFTMRDAGAADVPGAIEPIWRVLREGASEAEGKITYNDIKYMHSDDPATSVYDTFMRLNAGAPDQRQKLRNSCNVRGIVYSRMKFLAYLAGEKTVNITPGKVQWINPKVVFKLTPMTKKDLITGDEFGGAVSSAGLYIYDKGDGKSGTDKPRDFADANTIALPEADLVNPKAWILFDNSLTDKNGYEGAEFKAAGVAPKSLYYVLRGGVLKDEVKNGANTFSVDELVGPTLGDAVKGKPVDKSGLLSAEWWDKTGIIHQFKLDRERVILKNKAP